MVAPPTAAGFSRVIRAEHPELQFIAISFDNMEKVLTLVDRSLDILRTSYNSTENSFRAANDTIQIAKVVEIVLLASTFNTD
jgi:hypothetical protein